MSYQVGVDLGATFTAAAVCRSGWADVVAFGPHAAFLPSVAYVSPDGSLVLGEAAEQRALTEPDRVARQFSSRVGDGTPLRLGGVAMTADALTARFVADVVGSVAGMVGGPAARVALTHPAGWGQHRLASLRAALVAQGLGATVLLSGAQAAARAYAERVLVSAGDLVAVYDLGGTGFDAAVVRKLGDGRFEPAGPPEELEIGGLDFDELVFDHVRTALGERWAAIDPADPAVRPALARLRRECTLAKEALSADTDVRIPVVLPGVDTRVRLARAELEELVRPAVEETAATMYRTIDAAGGSPEDLSAVLLTGGSARIPLVTQILSEILGRPVVAVPNPKGETAIGAALAIGGPAADEPAMAAEAEPTRIALRAVPGPVPNPVRPPVAAGLPAPVKPAHRRFGLSRTLATAAAVATALVVGGGIVLASNNGPSGADAEIKAPPTTSETERAVTTTPPATTTKQPAPKPRDTEEPRRTRIEEPPPEEPTVTSEPPESTQPTETTTETTSTPPTDTTTTPTDPETPEDPPADEPAEPGQEERTES
ncbi:Hsp70 family protein [Actinophytocola sp.]|uniref:Hsp70 family protein n=1 Tax=Actinophytocola sp. TaxID=1872138 RepID=UPI003D6A4595